MVEPSYFDRNRISRSMLGLQELHQLLLRRSYNSVNLKGSTRLDASASSCCADGRKDRATACKEDDDVQDGFGCRWRAHPCGTGSGPDELGRPEVCLLYTSPS